MFYPHKFENRGGNAKLNAQYNLRTRTHYLDDDNMRFHKSRVLACHITDDGLLLTILESVGLDWDNTKRGFRGVVFDMFGNVVSTLDLEKCFNTREAARKDMWARLNALDAKAVTAEAIGRALAGFKSVCDVLYASLKD